MGKPVWIGDMVNYAQSALLGPGSYAGADRPAWLHSALSVRSKYKNFAVFDHNKMHSLLREYWPTASMAEAEQVCSRLETFDVLRRIPKTKTWNVVRPTKTREPQPYNPQKAVPKGSSLYVRYKPGECRKCGSHVRNTNRHNNKSHSVDECRHNIVEKIINE